MRVTWFYCQDARADDLMQQPPRPTQIGLFFSPNAPFQGEVLQLLYQKILRSSHFFPFLGFSQFGLWCHYWSSLGHPSLSTSTNLFAASPWKWSHPYQPLETTHSTISACWNRTHPLRCISQAPSSWIIPTCHKLSNPCTPAYLVCSSVLLTSFWLAFLF